MGKRTYEKDSEYILEVLEEEEDRLIDMLDKYISKDGWRLMNKLIAVRVEINNISNVKN